MCLFVAGDDTGGVSLWRIIPKSAENIPGNQPSVDGSPRMPGGEKGESGRSELHQESKLLAYMNVNRVHRHPVDPTAATATANDGTVNGTSTGDVAAGTIADSSTSAAYATGACTQPSSGENPERIVTLRFLPNTELLLIGTNKRLLLVVVGTIEKDHRPTSGTEGVSNWWSSSQFVAQGGVTRQQRSLLHWLSHSPSPTKKANTQSLKGDGTTFMSWVELDRVPAHCEGIFSMSVGVGEGDGDSKGEGDGPDKAPSSLIGGSPGVCCDDQSIILWKVVVDCETSRSSKERVRKYDAEDRTLQPNIPEDTGVVPSDVRPLSVVLPKEERSGSMFSMPSLQTLFNSATLGSSSPTAVLATPPQTPSKHELNLNLKQEKEQSVRRDKSSKSNGFLRKNVDVDLDDTSDCRVYRFKWTDEMFCTAFQGLQTVPIDALQDHQSIFY